MRLAAFALLLSAIAPAQSGPEQMLWDTIEKNLRSPEGEQYFEQNLKDSWLPDLEGKVVSSTINEAVSRLVLRMQDGGEPAVTLNVDHPGWRVVKAPEENAVIRFSGVGEHFTKAPFLLTFGVPRGRLKGLEFRKADK